MEEEEGGEGKVHSIVTYFQLFTPIGTTSHSSGCEHSHRCSDLLAYSNYMPYAIPL